MSDSSATPWTVARQAPLSMGFPRQESWSGWPCPSLRDLINPRIEPTSLMSLAWTGEFFSIEPPGEPKYYVRTVNVFTNIYSIF